MADLTHSPDALATGSGPHNGRRAAVAAAVAALALAPGDLGSLTREILADAYLGVSVFVAATLLLFYGLERVFGVGIGEAMSRARGWQVPMAALLGATPGCGGAVVVVAAYSTGKVRFGAVVATLTATMGDAAFLLIATRPDAAAVVLPLSFVVGVLTGWIVDRLPAVDVVPTTRAAAGPPHIGGITPLHWAFLAAAIPGLFLGIADLATLPIPAAVPAEALALIGVGIGLVIWAMSPVRAMTHSDDPPVARMAEETAFITIWVIAAFLAYDYAVAFAGLDLEAWFRTVAPLMPLIAIVIGFVPGCGPQVLVTTLYVNGLIPFAALVGNAISNDGDALFPAIAVNPRAAILATLYSAVPALIVAYGFYTLVPGFMN